MHDANTRLPLPNGMQNDQLYISYDIISVFRFDISIQNYFCEVSLVKKKRALNIHILYVLRLYTLQYLLNLRHH